MKRLLLSVMAIFVCACFVQGQKDAAALLTIGLTSSQSAPKYASLFMAAKFKPFLPGKSYPTLKRVPGLLLPDIRSAVFQRWLDAFTAGLNQHAWLAASL
jgi:hypothetical protein